MVQAAVGDDDDDDNAACRPNKFTGCGAMKAGVMYMTAEVQAGRRAGGRHGDGAGWKDFFRLVGTVYRGREEGRRVAHVISRIMKRGEIM